MTFRDWHIRPDTPTKGQLDNAQFLKVADQFISLANERNRKIVATDLHYALLYAAARYNAHVGKNVMVVEDHQAYIDHMVTQYKDMLREHMADPTV